MKIESKNKSYLASSQASKMNAKEETKNSVDPHLEEILKGKYEIFSQIGQGAQGQVYLGKCLLDDEYVAIKQLRVNSVENWKQYELFEREAKVLQNLNVPGTAKFYEAFQDFKSEMPVSVMIQEYIDGRSLQNYIDQNKRFSFEVSCDILIQLIDIIENLHQQTPPVIHRDIKPSNVILRYSDNRKGESPEVFLIDFGAVANPKVQDGGSTITGTYGYMAPEQLVGQPTQASDIYSFAMLAVYLLSGTPPEKLETKDLQLLIDRELEHLPYAITTFFRQMIEPSPIKRLTDYQIIRKYLNNFKAGEFEFEFENQDKSLANTKYQLENVRSIGQKGNIALWQAMPDKTPRPFPKEYQKLIQRDKRFMTLNQVYIGQTDFMIRQREHQHRFKTFCEIMPQGCSYRRQISFNYIQDFEYYKNGMQYIKNTSRIIQEPSKKKLYGCILLAVITFIISMMLIVTYKMPNFIFFINIILSVILYIVTLYQAGSWHTKINKWDRNQPFSILPALWDIPLKQEKEFQDKLEYIFTNGRKSLATISQIRFVSTPHLNRVSPESAEIFLDSDQQKKRKNWVKTDDSSNHATQEEKEFFAKEQPLWEITYYFNPPDDNEEGNLFHRFYSEIPPVELQCGDTLPILYDIKDGKAYSIPYPLPPNTSLMMCPDFVSGLGIKVAIERPEASSQQAQKKSSFAAWQDLANKHNTGKRDKISEKSKIYIKAHSKQLPVRVNRHQKEIHHTANKRG